MKWALILAAAFLAANMRLFAQGAITVTGQVMDSDGQTWNNGTCSATYVVPAGSGAITNKVTRQTISPATVSCNLDGAGSFSITLVSTANVYGPIVTAPPGATDTIFQASLDGTIQTGATAGTLNVLVYTGNASDAVTIKAGSYCAILP